MGESLEVPLTRQRWVGDGEGLDVGDRILRAIRPPVFDSPTTRGLYDPTTGVYWASDSFATPMLAPVRTVDEIDTGVLGAGDPHVRPLRQPVAHADGRRPLPGDRRPGRATRSRRSWPAATHQPSPAGTLPPRSPRRGSRRRPTCPTSPTKQCSSRSNWRSKVSPPDQLTAQCGTRPTAQRATAPSVNGPAGEPNLANSSLRRRLRS